jgi:hypothetical protein
LVFRQRVREPFPLSNPAATGGVGLALPQFEQAHIAQPAVYCFEWIGPGPSVAAAVLLNAEWHSFNQASVPAGLSWQTGHGFVTHRPG